MEDPVRIKAIVWPDGAQTVTWIDGKTFTYDKDGYWHVVELPNFQREYQGTWEVRPNFEIPDMREWYQPEKWMKEYLPPYYAEVDKLIQEIIDLL